MKIGQYEITSDGDYYTLHRLQVVADGKTKGTERRVDSKHFHGIDKLQAYLGRVALSEALGAANTLSELEERNQQAVNRLFEGKED